MACWLCCPFSSFYLAPSTNKNLRCTQTSNLFFYLSPPAAGSTGGAAWPPAAGLLAAGDLLSAPPRDHQRRQRGGKGEGPRHLQQTASPAAPGGG